MSPQTPEITPAALATRAAAELASGSYQAAQTTALVAIAGALAAPKPLSEGVIALAEIPKPTPPRRETWVVEFANALCDPVGVTAPGVSAEPQVVYDGEWMTPNEAASLAASLIAAARYAKGRK